MQLTAHVADAVDESLFHVHVDVFEFRAEGKAPLLNFPAYLAQGLFNGTAFIDCKQANLCQHLGVGRGTFDILRKQTAIEAHTFSELLDTAIRRHLKYTAPSFLRQSKPQTANGPLERSTTY
jgi:hypothetical protein